MKKILSLLIAFCVLGSASAYFDVVPDILSVQGLLTNSTTGDYLDGSYSMNFSIWNASSGGTMFWNETHPTVSLNLGYFDVLLGETGTAPDLGNSVFYAVRNTTSGHRVYLQITIDGETLSPRYSFGQAPYTSTSDWANMSLDDVAEIGNVTDRNIGIFPSSGIALNATSGTGMGSYGIFASGYYGIDARGTWGSGVYAYSSNSDGVRGLTHGSTKSGVTGSFLNTSTSGYGVYGESAGTSGSGVYGYSAAGNGYGVYGYSNNSYAVYGNSNNSYGVYGATIHGDAGVYGYNPDVGYGVYGATGDDGQAGVYGMHPAGGIGVFGNSSYGWGVYGYSPTGIGVRGASQKSYAVYGQTSAGNLSAIYGYNANSTSLTGTAYGVKGYTAELISYGVYGYGVGYHVTDLLNLGGGVFGNTTNGTGV
ncbi:hypothetical protein H0O03_01230, partial [Candidatus Micrarchaeota archaeon]|nr:hypothetical protein [Candidatus Micrarchaeota archaeon]